ncbi:glycosyltransferase involved in cell wall biosynthesis [Flavobacterium sp. W4I14]|nr:glycosyltransferase involved in cell wall biosynthesis [Flavobacterium sp. W4I14]
MDNIHLPLVSVVFTSYNHAEYLKQAIESIISQTFTDFEFIIVDDCSTDGSIEILNQYKNDSRVKLNLLEKNTGSYVKASHFGALKAVGKYILFAQCDDYAAPNQLQRLVDQMEANPNVGVVFSRSTLVDEHGKVISDDYSIRDKAFKTRFKQDVLVSGSEMLKFLSYSCVIPNLSAALVRRELYFKAEGLPERFLMAADWAFWIEMTTHCDFYYISESLNNFRQHATTIRSKTKIDKQLMEIFSVFSNHIDKHSIKGTVKNDLLIGFGNIWFTYFLESPRAVSSNFLNTLSKTRGMQKNIPYFLFKGIAKKVKAIIQK